MSVIIFVLLAAAAAPGDKVIPSNTASGSEMVCRHEARTGTRFTKRTCMTRDAWEARAVSDARALAEMRGRGVATDASLLEGRPDKGPASMCVAGRC